MFIHNTFKYFIMVFVGVLPYSVSPDGITYYLLGKESYAENYKDSGKWSGFGGKLELTDVDIYDGMAREAYEESMGFIGERLEIYDKIYKPIIKIVDTDLRSAISIVDTDLRSAISIVDTTQGDNNSINIHSQSFICLNVENIIITSNFLKEKCAYVSPLLIEYDTSLPQLYVRVYDYVRNSFERINSHPYTIQTGNIKDGFYEKTEIDWFTLDEIFNESDKMRPAFLRSVKAIRESGSGPLYQENL